jgi:hypothetical protein
VVDGRDALALVLEAEPVPAAVLAVGLGGGLRWPGGDVDDDDAVGQIDSMNQSAPSGPVVMPPGALPGVAIGNSVNSPPVVKRPIWLAWDSVNHSGPSGPVVMAVGTAPGVGTANSVMAPLVRP